MQGLADGYFILPYTLGHYFASSKLAAVTTDHPAFVDAEKQVSERLGQLLAIKGRRSPDSFHRELGGLLWDHCGMARDAAGLQKALQRIPELRQEFFTNLRVQGDSSELNQELERAGRVADFLEFAELMCRDALDREESCGGHFRSEHQTEDGEALRDDERFCHVSAWKYAGPDRPPELGIEPLVFESVKLAQRSYK
jgi:succinate dehydrogenase / fumarate reductase flavoprotein subunit